VENGKELSFPWAGGLNAGQYYNVDLDRDGTMDVVVFDRATEQFQPFLSKDQQLVYAPEYRLSFPQNIQSWVVFADYDNDGKQDLFTASGKRGIIVYRNLSDNDLQWELIADPLSTLGFSGFQIAIQLNPSDIPAISDIDSDGDLDIVVYNVNGRGNLEYYQNMSIENQDDTYLRYEAKNENWGRVRECGCQTFVFNGGACAEINERKLTQQKLLHVGGKALLAVDMDGDGDKDLLSSDEGCGAINYLENVGNTDEAVFTSFSIYPENVAMSFPAPYWADVNQDGLYDLLLAPNLAVNDLNNPDDLQASSYVYTNTGTNSKPKFSLQSKAFLQSEMIDVGEYSAPTLADYDNDGDLDLFIGHRGRSFEEEYYATIVLYENTGSQTQAEFTLKDDDYLNLSELKLQQLKIYFQDIDQDGKQDLLLSGAESAYAGQAVLYWVPNRAAAAQQSWAFELEDRQNLSLKFHPDEQLHFIDANGDNLLDVFVAKREGNLELYENQDASPLPNWQLTIENAGGISSSVFNRNLGVLLYDFDQNGVADLLRTDDSKTVLFYKDFLQNIDSEAQGDTVSVEAGEQSRKLQGGDNLHFSAAALGASSSVQVLVGSPAGGVNLFTYVREQSTPSNRLLVYPNPTLLNDAAVQVKAEEKISSLQIITSAGALVANITPSQQMNEMQIDVGGLATGMYLIRILDTKGTISTQKLLVR